MAEASATPAEGVVDETKNVTTATPAGSGESDKQAETGTAKPDNDDEKPVTHRDLRRVLKSKDHWKERALRLEGELKARQEQRPDQTEKKEEVQAPKREDYADYEAYLEARAEFKASQRAEKIVEERLKEREEKASKAKAEESDRELTKSWTVSVEKARAKYDDYDEKVQDESFNPSPAMARAMLESDQKAEIAYYLASNPEEMERIAKLSPLRQAAEILKLEDKVSAKGPAKKPSKAPAPIDPVGGGKGGSDGKLRDDLPIGEWVKLRNKQVYG